MQTIYSSMEMLAKLVSFRTVSTSSNLKMIYFIKDYLSSYGITTRLTFDEKKQKANLFAQIGPPVEGGVISQDILMLCLSRVRMGYQSIRTLSKK